MKSLLPLVLFPVAAFAADPALTIYNQNFGVVREAISLDLKEGENEVKFSDITVHLEPESVILRDPTGKVDLQILEQNFRNDPVTQQMMLSLFEGKELDFTAREPNGTERTVRGKVIRSGYSMHDSAAMRRYGQAYYQTQSAMHQSTAQPIIEVDGKLQFQIPGMPVFPALADETILKPELSWKLKSGAAGKVNAELCYMSGGMSWAADYNLVAAGDAAKLDLIGWVTMDNQSGRTFDQARIKLMAGDVRKIQDENSRMSRNESVGFSGAEPAVTEKSFDEYHLYTLEHPVTLRDRETKQVEFVRARGIDSQRIYVYDGAVIDWNRWRGYDSSSRRQNADLGAESNPKVWVMREFKNTKENGLGIALPKGRLRFYQRDEDGRLEFVGESEMDHTPQGETVRAYVGNAFDIVGERTRINFKVDNSSRWADESFEIKLRNRKKETVEVRVVERLYRWINWEIRENSNPFVKQNAQQIEFRVQIKPDEEVTLKYLVHYSW